MYKKLFLIAVMGGILMLAWIALHGKPAAAGPMIYSSLVINEIDYDQPGTDTAEFIELKNISASAINLDPYELLLVNGGNGGETPYQNIDLPAQLLQPGDYYVVCTNEFTVANCDWDVSPDINLVQNGAPDAVAIVIPGVITDTVSYEGNTAGGYTEGSGVGLDDDPTNTNWSIGRCEDGIDSDQNNLDFQYRPATPGAANNCPVLGVCGGQATKISAVQGSGSSSPLVGQEHTLEAIVIGDFQDSLGGFYLQEENADMDTDPLTSEGIFINDSGTGLDVSTGDVVRVVGTAGESNGLTQLGGISGKLVCGSSVPLVPVNLSLPVTSVSNFEPYESMLVTFSQPLYISEYYNFDRYGEIVLTSARPFQPMAVYPPGSPEAAQLALDNLLGRITLDDGRSSENPDPALHPNGSVFDLNNRFRGGDMLYNVTGVLDYRFGLFRIQPTSSANYMASNPRPQPPVSGTIFKAASLNVLNYFTTLNSRGANTLEEFERQRTKILAALIDMDADVIGLVEIENNGTALQNLVDGLNAAAGKDTYAAIPTGKIGTDEITVALIYQPASAVPLGAFAVLDDPSFTDPLGSGVQKNRPALAQTFFDNINGGIFTVVVNHLKSKGSSCGPDDDDPEQGNCSLTRTKGAEALIDWLAQDPTGSQDADFLILGDLNAYGKEDPISAIQAGPDDTAGSTDDFTDLIYQFDGETAYSYLFDGQLGYLDHALASQDLVLQVKNTTIWHINADEPDLLDYDMTYKKDAQDALYEPNAYRASDHDPVIVYLTLQPSNPLYLPMIRR